MHVWNGFLKFPVWENVTSGVGMKHLIVLIGLVLCICMLRTFLLPVAKKVISCLIVLIGLIINIYIYIYLLGIYLLQKTSSSSLTFEVEVKNVTSGRVEVSFDSSLSSESKNKWFPRTFFFHFRLEEFHLRLGKETLDSPHRFD